MKPIGSNSFAAQIYNGIQGRLNTEGVRAKPPQSGVQETSTEAPREFRLPSNATPRGDWVLSANANPQDFDPSAPRGSYLNLVV